MGSGIYSIGVSALKVAQAGLNVTAHNIANANTPGYMRQEIVQTASYRMRKLSASSNRPKSSSRLVTKEMI